MKRSKGTLLYIFLVYNFIVFGPISTTFAVDVRVITTRTIDSSVHNYNGVECNLMMEGPVKAGDLVKIQNGFNAVKQEGETLGFVCLNSPGGSYEEGLKIAKFFLDSGVGTIVGPNNSCFSACAIIFMAGTGMTEALKWPSRRLHAKGTLGFHAPFLQISAGTYDKTEVNNTFKAGITALAELIALEPGSPHLEFFHKELIVEMSRRGPNEVFLIDTVRKAIKFDINIYGLREPSQITKRMICDACGNVNPLSQFYGCISENEVKVMPTKYGVDFSAPVSGAEGFTNTCKVVTGRVGAAIGQINGPIFLNYALGSQTGELGLWHLYPPDTPLNSLPMN